MRWYLGLDSSIIILALLSYIILNQYNPVTKLRTFQHWLDMAGLKAGDSFPEGVVFTYVSLHQLSLNISV